MAGLHCTDCVYSTFKFNEEWQEWQGGCSRGYTLADPHLSHEPEMYFCARKDGLVPVKDPFGHEYLRESNVCGRFSTTTEAPGEPKARVPWWRRGRSGDKGAQS